MSGRDGMFNGDGGLGMIQDKEMSELTRENQVEGLSSEWSNLNGGCPPTKVRYLLL